MIDRYEDFLSLMKEPAVAFQRGEITLTQMRARIAQALLVAGYEVRQKGARKRMCTAPQGGLKKCGNLVEWYCEIRAWHGCTMRTYWHDRCGKHIPLETVRRMNATTFELVRGSD